METVPGDTNIINMCWHEVIILLPDGKYHQWDKVSKKSSIRVEYKRKEVEPGFFEKTPRGIIKMPKKFDGIRYIVSEKVLSAIKILYPTRHDFLSPGDQTVNAKGKVSHAVGFQVNSRKYIS